MDDAIARFVEERDPLPPTDRCAKGSALALDQLYRTQASRLSRFFARRADRQDVQDLVQEAFARIAGIGPRSAPVERPEAYLNTVATNLLRDRARSAAKRAFERTEAVSVEELSNEDPHDRLEQRDVIAKIDDALATLPMRRRRIFLLHRLDHLTYAEIGDAIGMSEKGVKKQMAKALYQLRCALGDI